MFKQIRPILSLRRIAAFRSKRLMGPTTKSRSVPRDHSTSICVGLCRPNPITLPGAGQRRDQKTQPALWAVGGHVSAKADGKTHIVIILETRLETTDKTVVFLWSPLLEKVMEFTSFVFVCVCFIFYFF